MGRHLRWDFPRLLYELKAAISDAVRLGHKDASSIGINTWGVDFGLLDAYGELMSNPFHYRDVLTGSTMDGVRALVPDKELYRRTGIQFMYFNTIYQLFGLKQLYPGFLERAKRLLFMPDLFGYYLTGEMTAEYSVSSTTALLDVKRRDWDTELLDAIGIDARILPPISMPGTTLGNVLPDVADETGLRGARVISVCGHDTASAVLASPLRRDNPGAFLSCGTWSLLGVELDEPLVSEDAFATQYTNEGGIGGSIRFLKNIMGQWMANEIKREYEQEHGPIGFQTMDALEREAPPFAAFVDVDSTEFAQPGHMSEKIAAFCARTGQKRPEGLGAIIRCINESIALSYRLNIDALEGILGYRLPELRVVGGGIKNKGLMHMAACALERPVKAGPIEASSAGNILAQLIAAGEIKDRWDARQIIRDSFDEQEYEPYCGSSGGATAETGASGWREALARYRETIRGH